MKEIPAGEIRRAVDALKRGGVIVLPTETVYGPACDPRNGGDPAPGRHSG